MKPRYSNLPSSMLPFIDLLSNVIGSLCLIVLVASLFQGVQDPQPDGEDSTPAGKLEQAARDKGRQAGILRSSIGAAEQRLAELDKAAVSTAGTAKQQEEAYDAQLIYLASMGALREDYRQKIAELERRRDDLSDLLKSLREQLAQRRPGLVPQDSIEVHFVGSGRDLKPTFLECGATSLTIYTAIGAEIIDRHDISTSDSLKQLMGKVRSTPQGTMILLVRPEGLTTMALMQDLLDQNHVRNGKLPIPGAGKVDLGPFDPAARHEFRKEN